MEIIKASEIHKKEEIAPDYKIKANDADAHAMSANLNKKESSGEMSSLFSSQTKQACADLKNKKATDDLEQRLKKYQTSSDIKKNDLEKNQTGEKGQEQTPDDASADELAREVAEHILISDKAYMEPGSANEVRIKIKSSILKNAHVHIIQEKDCLQVKLMSSDEQSIQTLVEARDSLEKQLEKNYKGLIRIKIVHLSKKGNAGTQKK